MNKKSPESSLPGERAVFTNIRLTSSLCVPSFKAGTRFPVKNGMAGIWLTGLGAAPSSIPLKSPVMEKESHSTQATMSHREPGSPTGVLHGCCPSRHPSHFAGNILRWQLLKKAKEEGCVGCGVWRGAWGEVASGTLDPGKQNSLQYSSGSAC